MTGLEIFDGFRRTPVQDTADVHINFMGSRTRHEFERSLGENEAVAGAIPDAVRAALMSSGRSALYMPCGTLPLVPSEDLFEWIDILEAIDACEGRFAMVELGAGYGRWLVNAAQALRRHRTKSGTPFWLCGVEPHPQRAAWMTRHFVDNGLDPADHSLLACGVSDGRRLLMASGTDPALTYGQKTMLLADSVALPDETRVVRIPDPHGSAMDFDLVGGLTLPEIIGDRVIDLLDVDVQGVELIALAPFIDVIAAQVRRVHVGTHSQEIEDGLADLFRRAGFVLNRRYDGGRVNATPFGPLHCVDGIQSWTNPRLGRGSA